MKSYLSDHRIFLWLVLCIFGATLLIQLPLRQAAAAQPMGHIRAYQKISGSKTDLGDALGDQGRFGSAVANIGDLDGDGIAELAVGAPDDSLESTDHRGAVWILFLKRNGKVTTKERISAIAEGFDPGATRYDRFGSALAGVGDLDRDGVPDLAVGVPFADVGGPGRGAVSVLFLNRDGTVKRRALIAAGSGGMPNTLADDDFFGSTITALGDLDGDGFVDLAVGAPGDDDGGEDGSRGAIWILYLTPEGTTRTQQKISATAGGFGGQLAEFDQLGTAIANIGDLDNDGVADLAAGVLRLEGETSNGIGALWILLMQRNGTVKAEQEIAVLTDRFDANPSMGARFGSAVAGIGDFNRDGIPDIAVGAHDHSDANSEKNRGAVWILTLSQTGLLQQATRISTQSGQLNRQLRNGEQFSWSITNLGDVNGDGTIDLAIGAPGDDDGGPDRGAIWLALLQ